VAGRTERSSLAALTVVSLVGAPAGDHLGEQRVQPADGAMPEGDQVPSTVQDQPKRLGEVLELHGPQPARMGGRDRDRTGIVLIGLAS
jgi:hypothetical protein